MCWVCCGIRVSDRQPFIDAGLRALAADLKGIDRSVYTAAGRDPCEPIFGLGPAHAKIAFFGRDPGREEVEVGMPFVGAGGRQIRNVLHARQPETAGDAYFWVNTVPYKPMGNKAWSMSVKRQFQPLVSEVLLTQWQGVDIITLGREAFFWFAIAQSKLVAEVIKAHWASSDRFTNSLQIDYQGPASVTGRTLRLHPLPHPSPLNAVWFKRFPDMLATRLDALEHS
ncbi:MAG: uracil-DNA glycosylase [Gammaproteobacteria bacterium]|nr:uracil-DNA glycosylase [Gammaproteobacteria bacterium]